MQIEQDIFIPNNDNKRGKLATIIAISIAIIVVAIIGIIFMIMLMQDNKLVVSIDGLSVKCPEDTFIFTDDGKIYISIKDIAQFVGYESHNGEYKVNVEDTNKMYVECKDETASFYYNSTTISKVAPNTNNEYENISISEPVVRANDKLYVISDGFTVGFNATFNYNKEKNRITIKTLPNLLATYTQAIEGYEFKKISDDFNNQKALVYGLIVGEREDKNFGVKTIEGNEIISPRYSNIQFIESSKEFIITNSSKKVGIAYNTGKTKITVSYDDIKVIDSKLGLYLVKSNNKYGIIDSLESFVIHIEYDQIGVDISNFPADNLRSQYILYDTIIPVNINGKWRLMDTKGNRITTEEYDEIGFVNKNTRNRIVNNALAIDDTKTIIVGKKKDEASNSRDMFYGAVDVKGNTLVPFMFDAIYSTTSSGETKYYLLRGETEYDAIELINAVKKRLGYKQEEISSTETKKDNTEQNVIETSTNATEETTNKINNVNTTNVGNMIYDGATSATEQASVQMDNLAVQQFNSIYMAYEGKQNGSTVKSLLNTIINRNNSATDTSRMITINGRSLTSEQIKMLIDRLDTSKEYTIMLNKDETTGYIKDINIS